MRKASYSFLLLFDLGMYLVHLELLLFLNISYLSNAAQEGTAALQHRRRLLQLA
jgi:hypothetical protein